LLLGDFERQVTSTASRRRNVIKKHEDAAVSGHISCDIAQKSLGPLDITPALPAAGIPRLVNRIGEQN
jgi:hypothetical protein